MNRKFILLLMGLSSFIILGMACSSDSTVESPMEETEVNVEADAVSNVIISDIGDNGSGLDFSVSFDKAADESKVSEYRIFVIKSASATTFDLAAANSVTSENYTQVPKTGENISTILTSTTKDIDGDLLQNDVDYIVHILTIADGTNSNINALSTASNSLTLKSSAVSNVIIADIGENGNGLDLSVSFDKAADESKVSEYRILVLKSASASTFDLLTANSVIAENYAQVPKTGENISTVLTSTANDIEGDVIHNDVSYIVYILTVADGTNSNINALSNASNTITIQLVAASSVTNIVGIDISNNGNASDLRIMFDVPADESSVKEYKVIIVNDVDASTFELSAAMALDVARVTTVAKTGNNIDIVLGDNAVESNGDPIVNGKSYSVFVMTVAEGVLYSLNAMSSSSNSILLGILTITYLQNQGVLISNGEIQILIDAVVIPGSLGGWVQLGAAEQSKILHAQAPYDQIDLILVTHHHGDHFGTSAITSHLNANPDTKFVAPAQVLSGFTARSQIINFDVPKFSRDALTVNNINIDILSLRHFDAFGNDFSSTINYGFLIELDGIKILHLGDVDMTSENFDNFDLANEGIDVVIIPTFVQSVHMTSTNRDVMLNQINPVDIIAAHLLSGSIQTITSQVLAIYPDAIIFETPFKTVTY